MTKTFCCLCLFSLCAVFSAVGADTRLGVLSELEAEEAWSDFALLCRICAAEESDSSFKSGFLLAAADAYGLSGAPDRMEHMLAAFESSVSFDDEELNTASVLLNAECAVMRRRWDEAAFYFESFGEECADADVRALAYSHAAAAALIGGDRDGSLAYAERAGKRGIVESYCGAKDKSPLTGGLLGIIPGLGYVYSGEYGNAFRCLLLNSLFIWAAAEFASDDEWALFSAALFFEITWYSGSIYGGIDAAHRYNRRRLSDASRDLTGCEYGRKFRDERLRGGFSVPLMFIKKNF